jgi:hypothetical protein
VHVSHVRPSHQAKLPIVSVSPIGVKGGEAMCIIRPSLHKASKANRFRGETQKDIKGVSRNNTREFRYEGRGRWGHIPSLGHRIGI